MLNCTVIASDTGMPSVSVPCGFTENRDKPTISFPKNIQKTKISSLKNINLIEAIDMMYKKLES